MSVEDVLTSCDLLTYVPSSAKLKSVGRERWRGICPILDHRSAATFSVFRHTDGHLAFMCFACNEGGNVINLVALLERITLREAIQRLSVGAYKLSPEAVMQRAKDSFVNKQGKYVLMCVAPGCLTAPLELADDLEAALALAQSGHAQSWFVAPDGVAALCPRH